MPKIEDLIKKVINEGSANRPLDQNSGTTGPAPVVTDDPLAAQRDAGGPTPQNSNPNDDSNKIEATTGSGKTGTRPADKEGEEGDDDDLEESIDDDDDHEDVSEDEETETPVVEESKVNEEERKKLIAEANAKVDAVLTEAGLTEDFKLKAKTLFESTINSQVKMIQEQLEAKYEKQLAEEVTDAVSLIEAKLDSYLSYTVKEWMKENELAIDQGIRTELSESFIESLKTVFKEHYVEIPEDKFDVVTDLSKQVEELTRKINESESRNIKLTEGLNEVLRNLIVEEVVDGLSDVKAEKIRQLAETVEFTNSEEYRKKIAILSETTTEKVSSEKKEEKKQVIAESVKEDFQKLEETAPEKVETKKQDPLINSVLDTIKSHLAV